MYTLSEVCLIVPCLIILRFVGIFQQLEFFSGAAVLCWRTIVAPALRNDFDVVELRCSVTGRLAGNFTRDEF